jgi:NADPH:quinone reductase
MKAIIISQYGGSEQLVLGEKPAPLPGPGQVSIRLHASGINFIDVYQRTGLYKGDLPFTPGMEGAGVVEAIGEGVTTHQPGDRVAYAMNRGSYAEFSVVPAWHAVKLPDAVSFEAGAAVMLQGMTAHYLVHSVFPVSAGHTVLIHAAAGGTGMLIAQMAKAKGAQVLGCVSRGFHPDKEANAKAAGVDHVLSYDSFAAEARTLTGGKGVDVVYDAVGAAVFHQSLDALKPRGMMATFGNASGAVPAIEPLLLNQKGSLFLTRPTLAHYVATPEELQWRAGDLLAWLASGKLQLKIDRSYPLSEARQAHDDLESRRTSGKLLLSIT